MTVYTRQPAVIGGEHRRASSILRGGPDATYHVDGDPEDIRVTADASRPAEVVEGNLGAVSDSLVGRSPEPEALLMVRPTSWRNWFCCGLGCGPSLRPRPRSRSAPCPRPAHTDPPCTDLPTVRMLRPEGRHRHPSSEFRRQRRALLHRHSIGSTNKRQSEVAWCRTLM